MYRHHAAILLRKVGGRLTPVMQRTSALTGHLVPKPSLLFCAIWFALLVLPSLALVGLAALAQPFVDHRHLAPFLIGATGFGPSYEAVSSLADLYEKTNTMLKVGIKRKTEEYEWFDDYPDELITVSGNENRIPLDLTYQTGGGMIPDAGYETALTTAAPTHGTFSLVQMNKRYSFSGLAQALEKRARAAQIQQQTLFSSIKAIEWIARYIGVQTYGSSTGTLFQVQTTASAGATQTGIQIHNAFGSSTFCPGGTTVQNTYLNNLCRTGENVALIRAGSIVEFGVVAASPSAGSGVGYIDITFNSSITPTAGDNVVLANAVTDNTINGTDYNLWPVGFTDILTATSVHGVSSSTYPNWTQGYSSVVSQRFGFAVKEAMINGVWNASGVQMDRIIIDQASRRDVIAGERGALRYEGKAFHLEGDLESFKYLTSILALPGTAIGWYGQAISRKLLSDKPDYEGGPQIFKLDKVQDRSATAAAYDLFYARILSSRGATAYATNLTGQ